MRMASGKMMRAESSSSHMPPQGIMPWTGGMPSTSHLVQETNLHWQAPPPLAGGVATTGPTFGQVAGVAKGHDGTVWVVHRAGRVWDSGSFEDNGAGERTLYTSPIAEPVVYQLDQDSGALAR